HAFDPVAQILLGHLTSPSLACVSLHGAMRFAYCALRSATLAASHYKTHIAQLVTTVVLIAAAFLGGALNSLAGGGTLNPIDANASSVVALFSGTFAGAWAYRRNIVAVTEFSVLGLFVLSLAGGLTGALLLLWTPTTIFAGLVPWLILFATIVFAVG